MRANDMRAGGQGAPLVPAYHAALARSLPPELCRLLADGVREYRRHLQHHLCRGSGDPIAFDTGPGNALIDQWVAREGGVPFDADGAIASEGGVVSAVVARYLDNPFFARAGPKSLDRSDFTLAEAGGLELADGARTLAAVSAEAILKSVEHLAAAAKAVDRRRRRPQEPAYRRRPARRRAKAGAEVILAEDAGLRGDFIEAEAWAYLAVRSLKGPAADLSDDDGMQGRPMTRRGAGAALMQASSVPP